MDELYRGIEELGNRYSVRKIVLFGSRARGDHSARSDVDLAVYGLSEDQQGLFTAEIDDLKTPLQFDLVFISPQTSPELLDNIRKEGVVIMGRFDTKLMNFKKALERLKAAILDYSKFSIDTVRDGVIQRFEFTSELAWKTMKEYLEEQGYNGVNSPKTVVKTAYLDGLINDGDGWISLLNDRNITSHIYSESDANAVYERITTKYVDLFEELSNKLKN